MDESCEEVAFNRLFGRVDLHALVTSTTVSNQDGDLALGFALLCGNLILCERCRKDRVFRTGLLLFFVVARSSVWLLPSGWKSVTTLYVLFVRNTYDHAFLPISLFLPPRPNLSPSSWNLLRLRSLWDSCLVSELPSPASLLGASSTIGAVSGLVSLESAMMMIVSC